jgi:serine/threonine-protein kinase
VKILPASLTGDAQYRERFNREADLAATLWHPHIVGLHDRGEFDGQLWIAMDYVDGTDASHLLRERHPAGLPVRDAVEITTAIADALDYAHTRQLLHRDVKPANILLTRAEAGRRRILLADFGVARRTDDVSGLTATNMTVGSMPYSAPEQLMGEPLDGKADQYSLAASAFQLLTGRSPFHHSNPAVVISKHLSEAPPRLSESHGDLAHLDAVITRGLAKEPQDRYPTCSDFAQALADAANRPGKFHAEPTPHPTLPTVQAHPLTPPKPAPQSHTPPQQPTQSSVSSAFAAPPQYGSHTGFPTSTPPANPQRPAATWSSSPARPVAQKPQKQSGSTIFVPAALTVLLIGGIGFAASQFARDAPVPPSTPQWQPYVDAAKGFAQGLVSVSADSIDQDIARTLNGTTGAFHDKLSDGAADLKRKIVGDGTKTVATVTDAGIQTFDDDKAVVLVSVNTKTTNNTNAPRQDAVQRLAVTMVSTPEGYKASSVEFVD